MQMRLPIFLKLTVPLILLIAVAVGLSGYLVYTESTQRWQEELNTRLDRVTRLLASTINTDTLQEIRAPADIDTAGYRAIQQQLQQALTASNLAWVGIYFRDRDYLYYWVDTHQTGVGYPFFYATPQHYAAFVEREPQRVAYSNESGAYYGIVVPIITSDQEGSQVIGVVEASFAQEASILLQRTILTRVLLILAGGIIVAVGLAAIITIALFNQPLRQLQLGAMALAEGNFGHTIGLNSRDELGDLAKTFNFMSTELERLYRERATSERAQRELEIAHDVQQALFPKDTPRLAGVEVAAFCRPHRETSGDFYDLMVLGDRQLGIVVGDVSGKSIPAAMVMLLAYSAIRSEAYDHTSPAMVLSEANTRLHRNVPRGMFIAVSYALLDLQSREMTWANAGQLEPVLFQNGTNGDAPDHPQYLATTGDHLPIGVLSDIRYRDQRLTLHPGSTVLFFTDGVVEAKNTARELYGFERLEALVRSLSANAAPQTVIDAVLSDMTSFVGPAEQHDDITLIAVRMN